MHLTSPRSKRSTKAETKRAVIDFVLPARSRCRGSAIISTDISAEFTSTSGEKNTKPPIALHLIGKSRVLETDTRVPVLARFIDIY